MSTMVRQYRISVTGKVQGVWFRKTTQDKALQLGLKGWVANESDGSVSIVALGEEEKLIEFIEHCNKGSENAEVKAIHIEEENPEVYADFSIQ